MSADTVLVAIGDVAALAAALFAFLALGKASETVREAKAARVDAEQAARDVAADRREAERDRQLRRVERVGEIVEDLYGNAGLFGTDQWAADRNRLGHALVGLTGRLPVCAALLGGMPKTYQEATQRVSASRDEVHAELERLNQVQRKPATTELASRSKS
jgi:hypothetical protein